jgi:hypothetical protein
MFGDFPAKNTVYALYIRLWSTLFVDLVLVCVCMKRCVISLAAFRGVRNKSDENKEGGPSIFQYFMRFTAEVQALLLLSDGSRCTQAKLCLLMRQMCCVVFTDATDV